MKKLVLLCCSLLLVLSASAKGSKDPSKWSISVTKNGDMYNVVFHVFLDANWHIWSLNPGGDGSLIGPSFEFKTGKFSLVDRPGEQGIAVESDFDGITGKVRYYFHEVQFNQLIKAHKGEIITGTYTYQLCSEKMCLPPKTIPFKIKIP